MGNGQSYGKRMWNIWGPLVIKFGISMILYIMGAGILAGQYFMQQARENGPDAMMEVMNDAQKYEAMMVEVTERLINFAVPLEGAAAIVTIPCLLFWMLRDRRKEKLAGEGAGAVKAAWWKYPAIAVISAALCVALNNVMLLVSLPSASQAYGETMEVLYRPSFAMQLACLGILIPICEEMVFRGLIYRHLRKDNRFMGAALYSSLIFAITHGNLVQGLYGFIMGMLFAYVYEKYGSVSAPVLGHIAANVTAVVGTQYNWFGWMMEDVMRVGIVTAFCAFVASTLYVQMQKMESAMQQGLSEKQ